MSEIDHELTDCMICPYCGYEDDEFLDDRSDSDTEGEEDCKQCNKTYKYQIETWVTCSTEKVKNE